MHKDGISLTVREHPQGETAEGDLNPEALETVEVDLPVAWDANDEEFDAWWNADYDDSTNPYNKETPAYWAWAGWRAAQSKRAWQGLTDEELTQVSNNNHPLDGIRSFARAIEAKLKEKNT